MRDIQFRGFDLDSKTWCYGYYIKHINATPCIFPSEAEKEEWYEKHTEHLIVFDDFSDWWLPRGVKIANKIDPKSLGQVSEWIDKKYKTIYEWDILKTKTEDDEEIIVVCKYGKVKRKLLPELDLETNLEELLDSIYGTPAVEINGFYFEREDGTNTYPIVCNHLGKHDCISMEVIGNVYENEDIVKEFFEVD